jgi:hypothetical protein
LQLIDGKRLEALDQPPAGTLLRGANPLTSQRYGESGTRHTGFRPNEHGRDDIDIASTAQRPPRRSNSGKHWVSLVNQQRKNLAKPSGCHTRPVDAFRVSVPDARQLLLKFLEIVFRERTGEVRQYVHPHVEWRVTPVSPLQRTIRSADLVAIMPSVRVARS